MRFSDIREGDKLVIYGKRYDVLYIDYGADSEGGWPNVKVRDYIVAALRKAGENSLIPTDKLIYYPDREEAIFHDKKINLDREVQLIKGKPEYVHNPPEDEHGHEKPSLNDFNFGNDNEADDGYFFTYGSD